MLTHGWPKLNMILSGNWNFPDPIGLGPAPSLLLATFAEFVCSLLVMAGFRIRLAAPPLIFTMLVAAFVAHAADPWGKKELPLLYAFCFTALALLGAGRFSLDHALARNPRPAPAG